MLHALYRAHLTLAGTTVGLEHCSRAPPTLLPSTHPHPNLPPPTPNQFMLPPSQAPHVFSGTELLCKGLPSPLCSLWHVRLENWKSQLFAQTQQVISVTFSDWLHSLSCHYVLPGACLVLHRTILPQNVSIVTVHACIISINDATNFFKTACWISDGTDSSTFCNLGSETDVALLWNKTYNTFSMPVTSYNHWQWQMIVPIVSKEREFV